MTRLRIYADFNGLMESPREPSRTCVPLDTLGSLRDLSNAGVALRAGLELTIHDASDGIEDLEADTVTYFESERRRWYAELVGAYRYVPAQHRGENLQFLCLGCRRDLAAASGTFGAAIVTGDRACPHCGTALAAAVHPPA